MTADVISMAHFKAARDKGALDPLAFAKPGPRTRGTTLDVGPTVDADRFLVLVRFANGNPGPAFWEWTRDELTDAGDALWCAALGITKEELHGR